MTKTITTAAALPLTIAESFHVHTLAAAMGAAKGEEVRISVVDHKAQDAGFKTVKAG